MTIVATRTVDLAAGFFTVVGTVATLYAAAALKEARGDQPGAPGPAPGLVALGRFDHLAEGEAATACADGERVAIVRVDGRLCALSNVCPHQNGPLGEGRVRDGYLECPWHGYQFDPRTGQAPPGFADSVPVHAVVTIGGVTYLEPS